MTKPNPQHLRQLAEAATPGEWRQGSVEKYHVFVECRDAEALGTERVLLRMNTWFPHEDDAAWIAAASPTTVIALLDELTALRAARDEACALALRLVEHLEPIPGGDYGGARDRISALSKVGGEL